MVVVKAHNGKLLTGYPRVQLGNGSCVSAATPRRGFGVYRYVMSRGLVIAVCFALLSSFFLGCESYMASCDSEPFTEGTGKSLDKLNIAKWMGEPSPCCSLYAVTNNVMAMANVSKSSASTLPVKVVISSSSVEDNNGVLARIWNVPAMLSLGIILPAVSSDKVVYTIQAETVVGAHEKTVEICDRSWWSLTPLAMIPVPGWADFRATWDFHSHEFLESEKKEYHAKTVAASTVQLLLEVLNEDWPKYISDRAQYDKIISFEKSEEAIRLAFDLLESINQSNKRNESTETSKGKVVKFSKYNRKGKYRGERYKIVGNPCISEYKEYDYESEAQKAISDSLSALESRRRQELEKIVQDQLLVVRQLAEVKDESVIEKYEKQLRQHEEQLKEDGLQAGSSELKEALSGLLDKLRLKRKRELAESLLEKRDWKRLRELCVNEKNEEFVSTYNPRVEQIRLEEVRSKAEDALAKGDWQRVLSLSRGERDQTIKKLAVKAEQVRLAEVRRKMEDALAQGDWQRALTCSKGENNKLIKELAARAEQIRLEEVRKKMQDALAKGDWLGVVKLCDDEQNQYLAKEFREKAETCRMEMKRTEAEALLAKNDWPGVVKLFDGEQNQDFAQEYRAKAETCRIDVKRTEAETLLAKNDWPGVAKLCDEEKDQGFVGEYRAKVEKMKAAELEQIKQSNNQTLLENIVQRDDKCEEFREAAIMRITNQTVLANIVMSQSFPKLRKAALQKLNDEETIKRVVEALIKEAENYANGARGNDSEESTLISDLCEIIRTKNITPSIKEALTKVQAKQIIDSWNYDDLAVKHLFCEAKAYDSNAIFTRNAIPCPSTHSIAYDLLEKISDINLQVETAAQLFERHLRLNDGKMSKEYGHYKISKEADVYVEYNFKPENIVRYTSFMGEKHVLYLLDKISSVEVWKMLFDHMPNEIKAKIKSSNEDKAKKIIARAEKIGKERFCIKGFYLGMSIQDAKSLVCYYLPESYVVITEDNTIEIDVEHGGDFDVTPMYFCCADKRGNVYLFNFDKRFLRKWFQYDVQDYHEWADAFGHEFNTPFRRKDTKGKYSVRGITISVKQEAYHYKDIMKGCMISVFGEKDVFDPYSDPTLEEMLNEFTAYRAGAIMRGKAWVKNDWENEDGAREGTLRIRLLSDDD